ncbi:MAG: helix-turn-helix domain-containing protein [Desulfuromonadales bacterium]|nr:helix-turn-helix domain-containing protein [Desulfuromonadales bacterium]
MSKLQMSSYQILKGDQMTREIYSMSNKELDRLAVIETLDSGTIKQKHAAGQLGLGIRQIRRLMKRYRQNGAAALISRRRRRPSNRCLAESVRTKALDLIRKHYHDFGPTFAHEKLSENHDLKLSVETLRQWMIADRIIVAEHTTTIYGRLQFNILASIGEFERGIIRVRSREGRERAIARGVKFGIRAKLSSDEISEMVRLFETDELSKRDICEIFGISRSSVYRLYAEYKQGQIGICQ